jgi:MFS family permease
MFYFITFFVQGVKDYGPLKTGVAFLPVALTIGVVSQIVARLLPKVGPKPLMITGTTLMTVSLLWLSTVNTHASYPGKILPGMIILAVAMGNLFVPLTVTAVSKVQHTDAGLASALLNVGQQVGGALGLSVMTTVFGTSARNWSHGHQSTLLTAVHNLPGNLPQLVGARISQAGQNGLQPADITKFVNGLPASDQTAAREFFSGTYRTFSHSLLAHASGMGFFAGAMFGVAAIIAAVVLINVKKDDLPAEGDLELEAAGLV